MSYATHCIPWDETCELCNPPSALSPEGEHTHRCNILLCTSLRDGCFCGCGALRINGLWHAMGELPGSAVLQSQCRPHLPNQQQ